MNAWTSHRAKIEELQAENNELKKKLEYFQLKEQKLHMQVSGEKSNPSRVEI